MVYETDGIGIRPDRVRKQGRGRGSYQSDKWDKVLGTNHHDVCSVSAVPYGDLGMLIKTGTSLLPNNQQGERLEVDKEGEAEGKDQSHRLDGRYGTAMEDER